MKYLNLDINHYLCDKDKGEKPIVILIGGCYLSYFINSLYSCYQLCTSYRMA